MWNASAQNVFLSLPAAALWALFAIWTPPAKATAAPERPLPPCTSVAGVASGACPVQNANVSGSGAGRFVPGGSLRINTIPAIGACSEWGKYTGIWAPSPCFARVSAPTVVGCGTIDLRDEKFRELPCLQALYRNQAGLPALFSTVRPNGAAGYQGRTACGDQPDFNTFVYGGPSTVSESVWTSRAGSALSCEMTFNPLRRPDGLYGPTWVKLRVEIGRAVTGDNASSGATESAEFFVPIDGDLRFAVDVDVTATATIQSADWDNGKVTAIYRARISNRGSETVENVRLAATLPKTLKYVSHTDSNCTANDTALASQGGSLQCERITLAAGSERTFEFLLRIVNATDLDGIQRGLLAGTPADAQGVQFQVTAADDLNTSNNKDVAVVSLPFRTGSYAQTLSAMSLLNQYFNYQSDLRAAGCNQYKDEAFARLEQIRADHPEVFANLSYGGVTSGEYDLAFTNGLVKSKGHVGVVVYPKGTNYRLTGIIINGTPSITPLSGHSLVGKEDTRDGTAFIGATSNDGRYLRTAADQFPGIPKEESPGGFEGRYAYNSSEFAGVSAPAAVTESCPFAPNAVSVTTESPVDLIITNPRGQRVETAGGQIVVQQLDSFIQTMVFRHEDGTYGWTIVLPVDTYDIQLRGTRVGLYRMTRTTYAADGTPTPVVVSAVTAPGAVDRYELAKPVAVAPPAAPPATPPVATVAPSAKSGGGSLDLLALVSLLGLLALRSGAAREGNDRRPNASSMRC